MGELAARVRALLRRVYTEPHSEKFVCGAYRFLPWNRRLEIDGECVALTQKECDLSLLLLRNFERLLLHYLLESIWLVSNPHGTELMSRSLDAHISRVRTVLN